jgi:hypothetical protein
MIFQTESLLRATSLVDNTKSLVPSDLKAEFRTAELQILVTDVKTVNVFSTSVAFELLAVQFRGTYNCFFSKTRVI